MLTRRIPPLKRTIVPLASAALLFMLAPDLHLIEAQATNVGKASPNAAQYSLVRLDNRASSSRVTLRSQAGEGEALRTLAVKLVWKKEDGQYTPHRVTLGWRGLPARVRQTTAWTVITEGGGHSSEAFPRHDPPHVDDSRGSIRRRHHI